MSINTIDASQQKAAKVAGLVYLLTLPVVMFAQFRIHDRLIVEANPIKTARNILAHSKRLM